jgi:hypothetical protein
MEAAQACTTKEEARELVQKEAEAILAAKIPGVAVPEQARDIVRSNIGYTTGWLDRKEAARILELFDARHPYFGAIEDWPKTPEETIELGIKVGMEAKARAGRR